MATHEIAAIEAAAFERGVSAGRVEGLAFNGVPQVIPWTIGARFTFARSEFDSYVAYERAVLEELRRVQRASFDEQEAIRDSESRLAAVRAAAERAPRELRDVPWVLKRWLLWRRPWLDDVARADDARDECLLRARVLTLLEQEVEHELDKVRSAVDAQLEEGRGRACVVEAMRRVPNRPAGVREYRDLHAFVREDPRRELLRWPENDDLGGMDWGYCWRLEDPVLRWTTTRWRVSWLYDSTQEVYAIEFVEDGHKGVARARVWLLGVLHETAQVRDVLGELEAYAQRERNSLAALAWAVSDATAARRTAATQTTGDP